MNQPVSFVLPDKDGTLHDLSAMTATFYVLFFYPRDNTPGCALEAREFSNLLDEFIKLHAQVIGISGGTNKSKASFCKNLGLKTLMLTDADFEVARALKVYGEKKFMGRTFNGISRTTIVLDSKRQISRVFEKVKPLGHAKAVLGYLAGLK